MCAFRIYSRKKSYTRCCIICWISVSNRSYDGSFWSWSSNSNKIYDLQEFSLWDPIHPIPLMKWKWSGVLPATIVLGKIVSSSSTCLRKNHGMGHPMEMSLCTAECVMDIAVLPIGIVPSILLAKTSTFSGIVIPFPSYEPRP